jgi:hypothetical protein
LLTYFNIDLLGDLGTYNLPSYVERDQKTVAHILSWNLSLNPECSPTCPWPWFHFIFLTWDKGAKVRAIPLSKELRPLLSHLTPQVSMPSSSSSHYPPPLSRKGNSVLLLL